jgi:hypothetical protein
MTAFTFVKLDESLNPPTPKVDEQGPSPVRMDPEKMAGLDLTSVGGDAYQDILVSGELTFRVATLFSGKALDAWLVVPSGYTGRWTLEGDCRELAITAAQSG